VPPEPFVRTSRDKRGYEQVWLVHVSGRQGRHARVLYWFRSPPGVRVGREPFDALARQSLQAQYPALKFDWDALAAAAALPPPEVEPWRERRKAQRAARKAWGDAADLPDEGSAVKDVSVVIEQGELATPETAAAVPAGVEESLESGSSDTGTADPSSAGPVVGSTAEAAPGPVSSAFVRRRRRGGRRGRRRLPSGVRPQGPQEGPQGRQGPQVQQGEANAPAEPAGEDTPTNRFQPPSES
jgi:hypothetical protein